MKPCYYWRARPRQTYSQSLKLNYDFFRIENIPFTFIGLYFYYMFIFLHILIFVFAKILWGFDLTRENVPMIEQPTRNKEEANKILLSRWARFRKRMLILCSGTSIKEQEQSPAMIQNTEESLWTRSQLLNPKTYK